MLPFGAAQRSSSVVHPACEAATVATTGAGPRGFNPSPRLTSCVALSKLLLLCGDWFSPPQNPYNISHCLITSQRSRGNAQDAAELGTCPSATWH